MVIPTILPAVEIVGHRGSSAEAPENTVASANLAWQEKADAVELDIYLTKDGKLVVLHDDDTKRTTGVPGLVGNLTLDEVRALDAGKWKAEKYAGEKIPTLEEILATGGAKKRFFIEIKRGPEVVPELKACLERMNIQPGQAVIMAFNINAAREAKLQLPQYQVLGLWGAKKDNPNIDEVIQAAKAANLDGLDLSFKWPIDAAFVHKVKAAGLGLWTWTVDDPAVARKEIEAGVDGITTNRPGWMREQLGM